MFPRYVAVKLLLAFAMVAGAQPSAPATSAGDYALTINITGIDQRDGNIGVLVFNSPKGWAENRQAALKDIVVPAQPGAVTVKVPDLPAGEYAVAVVHDVNKNHKLDRNWLGKPTEQWGLSNNPHAIIKTPSYDTCEFTLKGDMTIVIKMQQ
jgi:uncharacterized protein (DUF2141 family)